MAVRADAAGTVRIGGELEVARLGYGAMRLTGQPGNRFFRWLLAARRRITIPESDPDCDVGEYLA